jgi:hypothetical protein
MNTNTKAHLYTFVTLFGVIGFMAGFGTGISWLFDHYGAGVAVAIGFGLPAVGIVYLLIYVHFRFDMDLARRRAEIAAMPDVKYPYPSETLVLSTDGKTTEADIKPKDPTKRKLVPTNLVKPPKRKAITPKKVRK